jgi:hypothetical protein
MGGTGKTVSHGRELLLDKQVWSRRKQAGLGLCLAVEPRIPGLCCVVWHLCGCNVFHWEGLLQLVTTKPPHFWMGGLFHREDGRSDPDAFVCPLLPFGGVGCLAC